MLKRILITPLNWGLGHATRSMPVIEELINQGIEPILGCDGIVKDYYEKNYPDLNIIALPNQDIKYSKYDNKYAFSLKAFMQSRKFLKSINSTYLSVQEIVRTHNISGIISDHRFGSLCPELPSAIICHQLNLKADFFPKLAARFNKNELLKFDEVWVPDMKGPGALAGDLSSDTALNTKYIGLLSRFEVEANRKQTKLCVLLSGPEPQRTKLEKLIIAEINHYHNYILEHYDEIVIIRGKEEVVDFNLPQVRTVGLADTKTLQSLLNASKLVIARSGYSTIMDLKKLNLPGLLIPTPGQPEQEYLGSHLRSHFTIQNQHELDFSKLSELKTHLEFSHDSSALQATVTDFLNRC